MSRQLSATAVRVESLPPHRTTHGQVGSYVIPKCVQPELPACGTSSQVLPFQVQVSNNTRSGSSSPPNRTVRPSVTSYAIPWAALERGPESEVRVHAIPSQVHVSPNTLVPLNPPCT